nr:hypothetical protein Iba_chr04dCG2560 [Ipomoea batatas]
MINKAFKEINGSLVALGLGNAGNLGFGISGTLKALGILIILTVWCISCYIVGLWISCIEALESPVLEVWEFQAPGGFGISGYLRFGDFRYLGALNFRHLRLGISWYLRLGFQGILGFGIFLHLEGFDVPAEVVSRRCLASVLNVPSPPADRSDQEKQEKRIGWLGIGKDGSCWNRQRSNDGQLWNGQRRPTPAAVKDGNCGLRQWTATWAEEEMEMGQFYGLLRSLKDQAHYPGWLPGGLRASTTPLPNHHHQNRRQTDSVRLWCAIFSIINFSGLFTVCVLIE